MNRTRRAALALAGAAASILAVESLGFSTGTSGRDGRIEVSDDADAYLGLVEDDVEAEGLLFEDDEPRLTPARFDVINQLTEPTSVRLEADAFTFDPVDDDGYLLVDTDADDPTELPVGKRVEAVTVDVADGFVDGGTVTDAIEITATADYTLVEATRELTLDTGIDVEAAALDMAQMGGGVFAHEWRLEGVRTGGDTLEALHLDYHDVTTNPPVDLTSGEDQPSVSVFLDDARHEASITSLTAQAATIDLAHSLEIDDATVRIRLRDTGPPASPGGGVDSPSGAFVEAVATNDSANLEADWKHLLRPGPQTDE